MKREPSSDLRQAAAAMHEMYTALCDAGFDERQSLTIVGEMLRLGTQGETS